MSYQRWHFRIQASSNGYTPIYTSEIFSDVLTPGTVLTDEWTKEKYEVVGYIPQDSEWVDENDLIRFPILSING